MLIFDIFFFAYYCKLVYLISYHHDKSFCECSFPSLFTSTVQKHLDEDEDSDEVITLKKVGGVVAWNVDTNTHWNTTLRHSHDYLTEDSMNQNTCKDLQHPDYKFHIWTLFGACSMNRTPYWLQELHRFWRSADPQAFKPKLFVNIHLSYTVTKYTYF
jgi:hypothetical protein